MNHGFDKSELNPALPLGLGQYVLHCELRGAVNSAGTPTPRRSDQSIVGLGGEGMAGGWCLRSWRGSLAAGVPSEPLYVVSPFGVHELASPDGRKTAAPTFRAMREVLTLGPASVRDDWEYEPIYAFKRNGTLVQLPAPVGPNNWDAAFDMRQWRVFKQHQKTLEDLGLDPSVLFDDVVAALDAASARHGGGTSAQGNARMLLAEMAQFERDLHAAARATESRLRELGLLQYDVAIAENPRSVADYQLVLRVSSGSDAEEMAAVVTAELVKYRYRPDIAQGAVRIVNEPPKVPFRFDQAPPSARVDVGPESTLVESPDAGADSAFWTGIRRWTDRQAYVLGPVVAGVIAEIEHAAPTAGPMLAQYDQSVGLILGEIGRHQIRERQSRGNVAAALAPVSRAQDSLCKALEENPGMGPDYIVVAYRIELMVNTEIGQAASASTRRRDRLAAVARREGVEVGNLRALKGSSPGLGPARQLDP